MSEENNLNINNIKKEIGLDKESILDYSKFKDLKKDIEELFSKQNAGDVLDVLIGNALSL